MAAAGIAVVENRFLPLSPGVSANQAMALRSSGVLLRGNSWNGADRI